MAPIDPESFAIVVSLSSFDACFHLSFLLYQHKRLNSVVGPSPLFGSSQYLSK
jgi:hypothetical protein